MTGMVSRYTNTWEPRSIEYAVMKLQQDIRYYLETKGFADFVEAGLLLFTISKYKEFLNFTDGIMSAMTVPSPFWMSDGCKNITVQFKYIRTYSDDKKVDMVTVSFEYNDGLKYTGGNDLHLEVCRKLYEKGYELTNLLFDEFMAPYSLWHQRVHGTKSPKLQLKVVNYNTAGAVLFLLDTPKIRDSYKDDDSYERLKEHLVKLTTDSSLFSYSLEGNGDTILIAADKRLGKGNARMAIVQKVTD